MKNSDRSSENKISFTQLLQAMEKSAKQHKEENPEQEVKIEELPTVRELLDRLLTPGTALYYPEREIVFNNKLSPVKSVQVRICSTEASNQRILHKLHTLTRYT